jgi:hypothetical protein
MYSKYYALYGGILMMILGLFALFFQGTPQGLPELKVDLSYGLFLGLLPINIFNKFALIGFGIIGIYCSGKSNSYSIFYCQTVCYAMGALSLLGMFPATNTLGGIWPLFGAEVFAHMLFAVVAGMCAMMDLKVPASNVYRGRKRH